MSKRIPNHILDALFNWKLQKTYKLLTKKFRLSGYIARQAEKKLRAPSSALVSFVLFRRCPQYAHLYCTKHRAGVAKDPAGANLVLSSEFNRQRVIISACAETIDQNVIQRLHVWQFTQEGDHV